MDSQNQAPIPSPVSSSAPMLSAPLIGPINLLKYAWGMYKAHWKALTTIILFPSALFYIGIGLASTNSSILVVVGVVVTIIGVVLSLAAYIGLLKKIHQVDVSPESATSLKEQYAAGFKLFWSLILISIISSFVTMGSGVLFIIPGIIIAVYTYLGVFALVIDDKRGFSALTESFSVARGRWWKTLGRIIIILLIQLAIMLVAVGLRFLLSVLFGYGLWSASVLDTFVSLFLDVIILVFFTPFSFLYLYKMYVSLKETRIAETSTKTFKRWLVAFLVIGIIVIPGLLASVFFASMNAARKAAEAARYSIEQAALQQQNATTPTTPTAQ